MAPASKYIRKNFEKSKKGEDKGLRKAYKERIQEWRKDPTIKKIEKPTNPIKAKQIGYKAKQGFVVARVKERKGSGIHIRPNRGRRPKRMGTVKRKRAKSHQRQAEEKASKKYPNLVVVNSYLAAEDGNIKFFEVIMADPEHPSIKNDSEANWVTQKNQRNRAQKGKTSAGRKGRNIEKA
ncbi:MAG: 50S ribosomal protein L15e [archaeon]